jgi:hypothetical protein
MKTHHQPRLVANKHPSASEILRSSKAARRAVTLGVLPIALCAMWACGGQTAGAGPGTGGSAGSSNTSGSGGSTNVIMPAGPAIVGQHVLVYQGSPAASQPSTASVGSALGVAFVQSNLLRFAVGNVADASAPVVVVDVPSGGSHFGLPLLTASPVGFDLFWRANIDGNFFHVGFDTTGRVVEPIASLGTGDAPACGAAANASLFAIVCSGSPSTVLRLCARGGMCSSVVIGNCSAQPAVAWDGAAFDVAQSCNDGVELTRVDAAGRIVLPTRVLVSPDAPFSSSYTPGLFATSDSLTIAFGPEPQVATFDLAGALRAGPYRLGDAGVFIGTTGWHQVVPTANGYAVVTGRNLNLLDGSAGESDLYGFDRNAGSVGPIRLSDRAALNAPGLIATARGITTVFETGQSDLVRDDFDPAHLDQPTAARFFLNPIVSLAPYGLHCDTANCSALAGEAIAGLGELRQGGVWRIALDTGTVMRPAATVTRSDRFHSIVPAIGPFGAALVVPLSGDAYVSQELVWFGSGDRAEEFPLPRAADFFYSNMFAEKDALRLFRVPSSSSIPVDQLPFSGTAFGIPTQFFGDTPSPLQCQGGYLALRPSASQLDVLQWRPGIDDSSTTIFSLPASDSSRFEKAVCNDALLGLLVDVNAQTFIELFDYAGQLRGKIGPLLPTSAFASSNKHIVLLSLEPLPSVSIVVYDIGPDATVRSLALQLPAGTAGIQPGIDWFQADGAIQVTDHQLRWLWADAATRDVYLSTWALP